MADWTHDWEGCRFYRHVSPYVQGGRTRAQKSCQSGDLVAQTQAHRICIDPVSNGSAGRFYSISGWPPPIHLVGVADPTGWEGYRYSSSMSARVFREGGRLSKWRIKGYHVGSNAGAKECIAGMNNCRQLSFIALPGWAAANPYGTFRYRRDHHER
jgi:hypothetical protein